MSLPFLSKKPFDLPPIVSVELIQITEKTNIPYAPKAKKIIEKIKEEEKKLVSEQAPPKKVKKEKQDAIPLPDKKIEKVKKIDEKKQNPEKVDTEVKQVSEREKQPLVDPDALMKLIDKSKVNTAKTTNKTNKITQDQDKSIQTNTLSLSEEDALKAQLFACWSIPLGIPFSKDLLVRVKLKLKPDGSIIKTEVLDRAKMGKSNFYRVLAESVIRAVRICDPLRVPAKGYERWKDIVLNFDATGMIGGG